MKRRGVESDPDGNALLGGNFTIFVLGAGIGVEVGAGSARGGAAAGAGPVLLRLPPGVNPTSVPWSAAA